MLHASALAGACAGLVSSIVTCPLDVVKTKLQAQSGPTRPLRQGWSGPAGHPNGSIGGGGARLAYEAQRRSQAIKEAITGEGAESRYEGLFGKCWAAVWVKMTGCSMCTIDSQEPCGKYGEKTASEASTGVWGRPSLGTFQRGPSTLQFMTSAKQCWPSGSIRLARRTL